VRGGVRDGAANDLAGSEIAAHRVDRDAHPPLHRGSGWVGQRWPSAGVAVSMAIASRPS
jgi:hypothetical protein